jgi:Leucine Rich repeat
MPKKTSGKSAKKEKPIQDESTEKVYRQYRKNLQAAGLQMPKKLAEKFVVIRDEKNPSDLNELVIWEEVGAEGMRALADALKDLNYRFLREVHLWGARIEDEGIRALSQYLIKNSSVTTVDLTNCSIGPLGCEFIGNMFGTDSKNFITKLKIDYNDIGDKGMEMLAEGLRTNTTLVSLSLGYCNITQEGSRHLLEIVINTKTAIKDLNLQGNHLRNYGVVVLFRGLSINNSIETLDLADNQFGEEEAVIDSLKNFLIRNKKIKSLNFKFNGFYEDGARKIFDFLISVNENELAGPLSLTSLELPEKIPNDLLKSIEKAIKDNKKKKSKGKSKKKGKKKGKKKT